MTVIAGIEIQQGSCGQMLDAIEQHGRPTCQLEWRFARYHVHM